MRWVDLDLPRLRIIPLEQDRGGELPRGRATTWRDDDPDRLPSGVPEDAESRGHFRLDCLLGHDAPRSTLSP